MADCLLLRNGGDRNRIPYSRAEPMDNLVVAFRFAPLTALAGAVDNRQADSQVTHSLPTRLPPA
jgi:hypothetical protein